MIVTTRILFYITDFNSWKASNAATGDEVSNLYLKNNNNKQTKSKKQKKKKRKKPHLWELWLFSEPSSSTYSETFCYNLISCAHLKS